MQVIRIFEFRRRVMIALIAFGFVSAAILMRYFPQLALHYKLPPLADGLPFLPSVLWLFFRYRCPKCGAIPESKYKYVYTVSLTRSHCQKCGVRLRDKK